MVDYQNTLALVVGWVQSRQVAACCGGILLKLPAGRYRIEDALFHRCIIIVMAIHKIQLLQTIVRYLNLDRFRYLILALQMQFINVVRQVYEVGAALIPVKVDLSLLQSVEFAVELLEELGSIFFLEHTDNVLAAHAAVLFNDSAIVI